MKEIRINIVIVLLFIFLLSTIMWIVGIYNGEKHISSILYLISFISGNLCILVWPQNTNEEYVEELRMKKQKREEKARKKEEKRRQREIQNSPTAAGKPFP